MQDQWIAILAGTGALIALRVLDFFLPKGWVSTWTKRHGEKNTDDELEAADD